MANPDSELLARLTGKIHDGLREALNGADRVALVNFPNHGNPGDPAIWLGTRAALRRLRVRVAYQCAWDTYSEPALRRAVPHGPVLINGGGNFGDLYAGQQGLREKLLATLRDMPLIQLPQSIHFRKTENLDRMRKLIADHGDVTLLVREHRSETIAKQHFDAQVRLIPDMAFGLGELPRIATPTVDVTWLHRLPGDPEYVDHGAPPPEVTSQTVEWINPLDHEPPWRPTHRLARKLNTILRTKAQQNPTWANHAWRPLAATFTPLSHAWVRRGLHVLDSGRVLVTDKLHGHILALLAGIPHIVLDNGYGKVSALYQTWTKESKLTHWSNTGPEARTQALKILSTQT